ncbi:MAG: hypothetical protein FI718_06935 [SAR202 cluster bacterium]|nr:hypothetical protein [SAR202 cluster bacterium]|tara:strand:- start:16023 stop:16697 length:675 start_codon:yes stop_codon:yes gene_type:complete
MNQIDNKENVKDILDRIGKCSELISIDPHFKDISVGLYEKNNVYTVWTFSKVPGVSNRISEIRDQLVNLGGMVPVSDTNNQVKFPNDELYDRPVKFLIKLAVEKPSNYRHPDGPITIKDLRSPLTLIINSYDENDKRIYEVTTEGEFKNPELRKRATVQGFIRYGDMEKIDNTKVMFKGGYQRDELVRIILPYARNITGTQDMLDADSMRGQMTTSTLGFSTQE